MKIKIATRKQIFALMEKAVVASQSERYGDPPAGNLATVDLCLKALAAGESNRALLKISKRINGKR